MMEFAKPVSTTRAGKKIEHENTDSIGLKLIDFIVSNTTVQIQTDCIITHRMLGVCFRRYVPKKFDNKKNDVLKQPTTRCHLALQATKPSERAHTACTEVLSCPFLFGHCQTFVLNQTVDLFQGHCKILVGSGWLRTQ